MRTRIVVNATAGRGRAGNMIGQVQECLARQGIDDDFVYTESSGHGVKLAFEAAMAGYERVVAMGGDGTATEVANGLLLAAEKGREAVLGVIPVGSGNDFAYGVGVSREVEAACHRLAEGKVRTIDMIRVTVDGESRVYGNSADIGYGAEVLLETQKMKRLRGFLLYLVAIFRVLTANDRWPYPMSITVDGQPLPHKMVTLVDVSNGPRTAGGFYLVPDARTDDGVLDVCVADRLGRLRILPLLVRALKGAHVNARPVTILQGRHVLIESDRGVPGHVDGEVLCTAGRRFEFEILPGRLGVWC